MLAATRIIGERRIVLTIHGSDELGLFVRDAQRFLGDQIGYNKEV
jgi:hypothetical protein